MDKPNTFLRENLKRSLNMCQINIVEVDTKVGGLPAASQINQMVRRTIKWKRRLQGRVDPSSDYRKLWFNPHTNRAKYSRVEVK